HRPGASRALPRLAADAGGRGRPLPVRRLAGRRPRGGRAGGGAVRTDRRDRPLAVVGDGIGIGGLLMRRQHRAAIALGVVALAAGIALAAQARPSAGTAWARISGPTQPGAQLGLARTADGVLHVVWNKGNSPTSIYETRVSPAGRAVGTSTVA